MDNEFGVKKNENVIYNKVDRTTDYCIKVSQVQKDKFWVFLLIFTGKKKAYDRQVRRRRLQDWKKREVGELMGKLECSVFCHRVSRFKYTHVLKCIHMTWKQKRLMVEGDLCGGKREVVGGG